MVSDVIIKGMEMPRHCIECRFMILGCCVASGDLRGPETEKCPDWCPLAPAPDDLIEADGGAFIDALLTSYENQRWIPADKPPEPGERVILRSGVFVGEGYYTSAHTWRRITGMPMRDITDEPVTHWMPLPEVPE